MSIAQRSIKSSTLGIAFVGILVVAVAGKLLLGFMVNHGVYYERSRLQARTVAIANALAVDSIRTLTGLPADEGTPAFHKLALQLMQSRVANNDARFVYLMGMKGNKVEFLLDSTNPSSDDYSPPGEEYPEASAALIRSFANGEPFVEGPVTDRWGIWVSGLAPIIDPSSHRVLAVLGLDISATRWRIDLGICRTLSFIATGIFAWIVVFFSVRLRRRLGTTSSQGPIKRGAPAGRPRPRPIPVPSSHGRR